MSTHRGADESLGLRPGEDDSPFCPSAPLRMSGWWGRCTDQEAVPGLGEPPLPVSAGAERRVHGPRRGEALAGVFGVRFLPNSFLLTGRGAPRLWSHLSEELPAGGGQLTVGTFISSLISSPFKNLPAPHHILLGMCLFSAFISVAVVNGKVCVIVGRWA